MGIAVAATDAAVEIVEAVEIAVAEDRVDVTNAVRVSRKKTMALRKR